MADTIKIGNIDISAFKVGSGDCKVYLGDALLYPTTPPTPSYKWLATYTGGTTSSAECDASSATTQNEITLTGLVSVEIGDCVTTIGDYTFSGCSSLTSCTIGSGVNTIGTGAFYYCTGFTSVNIPSGVTKINASAFHSCSGLTSIDIPDSVTSIGNNAFTDCDSITSVTIGSGVTSIGNQAFTGVVNKVVTVFPSTPPTIASNYLRPFTRNYVTIYVPSELVDTYKADANWSYYASRIQAIP